jgi:hypothetical protein
VAIFYQFVWKQTGLWVQNAVYVLLLLDQEFTKYVTFKIEKEISNVRLESFPHTI